MLRTPRLLHRNLGSTGDFGRLDLDTYLILFWAPYYNHYILGPQTILIFKAPKIFKAPIFEVQWLVSALTVVAGWAVSRTVITSHYGPAGNSDPQPVVYLVRGRKPYMHIQEHQPEAPRHRKLFLIGHSFDGVQTRLVMLLRAMGHPYLQQTGPES